ncbi:MAG: TIGR00730 family Rossman fold protein [Polaromonas sp.]|nr:TIGR00730 family Rossman fold protein [Polaromonas sp.]
MTPDSPASPGAASHASAPAFSICVYCGSRPGTEPAFAESARLTGEWIARHGGQLVYGGGRNGLMGIVADAALQAGASVIGVIPKALVEKEWAHTGCTELHVVDTMHERKRIMAEKADAFIALPGGIGTLEEFFEAWTWRQLAYHDKPTGLLNLNGYYDSLLGFLDTAVKSGFMTDALMKLIQVDTRTEKLLETLVQQAGFNSQSSRLDQL